MIMVDEVSITFQPEDATVNSILVTLETFGFHATS